MFTLKCTHDIQDNKYTKYASSVIYIGGVVAVIIW